MDGRARSKGLLSNFQSKHPAKKTRRKVWLHDKLGFCAAKKHKESSVIIITADVCRISVTWSLSHRSDCVLLFPFFILSALFVPLLRVALPQLFLPLPLSLLLPSPSLHPSTAHALRNHKASFILKHHIPLSAERGHHYYCMSSFSVPLFSSVHPLLPGATLIMAAGDSGQTGWLLQLPRQPWVAAPSRGFAWVSCVHFRHVSSASWLFVSTLSRAITGLFGMLKSVCISLFQAASGSISLPRCCCCCCCCCFDAVLQPALFLNSLITAPDRSIHLERHMLVDTCYLSLIVVFHCDIFGTKSLKSQGWCTHTHTHIPTHAVHTHFQTVSLTSSQCWWFPSLFELATFDVLFLRYPQPRRAFSCPLLGPSHYYTRRHLSSSSAACWISKSSSVAYKINFEDGPCESCMQSAKS